MALLDDDRLFPADRAPRDRARALRRAQGPADRLPARPHRSALVCRERSLSRSRRSSSSCPTTTSSACCSRRASGSRTWACPAPTAAPVETDGRAIWRRFAENYHLFRGTPTRLWLDHTFEKLFGVDERLSADTADASTTASPTASADRAFRPRALFERFNIEVIATTESALDDLRWHQMIRDSGWTGSVVTAYRPDAVVDPDFAGLRATTSTELGEITGCDTGDLGRLPRRAPRRGGPSSRTSARPRPITATPPPRTADLSAGRGAGALRQGAATAPARPRTRDALPRARC